MAKLRITFMARISAEDRTLFTDFFELYGAICESNDPDEVVVIPNRATVDLLKAQLSAWQSDGALTWADAI
jgi:hypothetical protein